MAVVGADTSAIAEAEAGHAANKRRQVVFSIPLNMMVAIQIVNY